MLIAIDANELCSPRVSGVKSYTYNLLKALIDLDSKNKFVLYSKSEFREEFRLEISKKRNFFHKIIKWPFPFWTYTRFPLELRRMRPDVLFMPIQAIPFFLPKCKIVVIVHDLAFLKFPDDFTFKDRLTLSFHTRRAARAAARIIVPSQSTREDIIRYYKVNPEKIRVVYHGYEKKIKNQKPVLSEAEGSKVKITRPPRYAKHCGQAIQNSKFKKNPPDPLYKRRNDKFHIQKPYILFVGAIQPRKNIQGLIKAFEILKSKFTLRQVQGDISCHSEHFTDAQHRRREESRYSTGSFIPNGTQDDIVNIQLVIVGPKGWLYKDIFKKARKSKYAKDIIFTGPVSKEELAEIYRSAEVFVLPSFYEGFGLTMLEAMARGIPVVASNISSMPEVVGRAAVLVDPYNINEIAEAIYKVITDKALKERLAGEGLKQVEKFSWEKCAKQTLNILLNG